MIPEKHVSPPHREEGSAVRGSEEPSGSRRGVVVAKRRIVSIVAILILAIIIPTFFLFKSQSPRVHLPDGTVTAVEIADSPEERRIGLSEHIFLDPDRGMLFLLDDLSRPAFWMKDMDFPIDIVWLRDGIVVGIEPNLQPATVENPPSVRSNGEINQVLEVNAGFALEHGLKTGQTLDIKLP